MGSMPVWPTLCALMAVATNASNTTMTEGTGPRLRPKHATSATAATAQAARLAETRRRRLGAPASASAFALAPPLRAVRAPLSVRAALGRMFLQITPTPATIMTPMPRLEAMPCALATSQSPADEPPATMPKFASSAPANHTATAPVPTRNPTARSMGEL